MVDGCSLSPELPQLGDNGGAHGTTPVKPIAKDAKEGHLKDAFISVIVKWREHRKVS